MMELTCAFLLVFVGLVSATPYGYGVKGGAGARAESSASAGAFSGIGDVPVAIPLGAGYSGSFSKSSSSSSSSSSASSSSSSSSFNYGGSAAGASGFGLNGDTRGNIGCSSGNCQTPGSNGIHASLGAYDNVESAGCTSGNCHIPGSNGSPTSLGAHGNVGSAGCPSGNCQTPGSNGNPASFGAHGNIGSAGCTSGNCHTPGSNGNSAPLGSSLSGYNTVNAAAVAGAGIISGSGCQGLSCGDDDASKCKFGQCKPKSETGTSPTDSDTNKCTSGQCGSSQNGANPTEYDSNDIRAVSDSSKSTYSSKDQYSNIDKVAVGSSGSDCSQGNCGSPVSLNSKPNYGHVLSNSYQGSSASDTHHSSSKDSGITTDYHKPASHLETPKLDSKCTFGGCESESIKPGHQTSPSSYNVPIHGSYDNGEPKSACDGVKCENQPKGTYFSSQTNTLSSNFNLNQQQHPSGNTATKGPLSTHISSGFPNCAGSNCVQTPSSQTTGVFSPTVRPSNTHFGGPTDCKTPNCSPYPTNHGSLVGPNAPSGHIGDTPSHGNTPSKDKLPAYTAGFGGPAGLFKPNEFNVASTPSGTSSSAHPSTPHSGPAFGTTSPGCNSPNCFGLSSSSGANAQAGTYKPSGDINVSKEVLPPYTGGFGGPTGMLKPNEFEVHSTNKPNYVHPTTSLHTTHPSSNIGAAGCTSPNCGAYFTPATSLTSSPTASFGTTKPSIDISLNEKLPAYSGGFGGPAGLFKPNEYNSHSSGPSGSSHISNIPISGSPASCKTPNCYPSNVGSSAAANSQSTSFGVNKPSTTPHLSSVASPAGGYEKPSGITNPIEVSGTSSPSSPGSIYSTGCHSGDCKIYPSSGAEADANAQSEAYGITKPNTGTNPATKFPQYTGSFSGPSGTLIPTENTHNTPATGNIANICKTSNCGNSATATAGATSAANAQSGSFAINKPGDGNNLSKEKLPAYTGGFGGPAGLFKPNEYTAPAVKPTSNNHQPLVPTVVSKPSDCIAGNCNPQGSLQPHISASHAHNHASAGAHATSNAEANAVLYTGGFGGPPGVLKPYDDGKIKPLASGAHPHGPQTGAHFSSPSANTDLPHGANLGAISGPTANAGLGQVGSNGNSGAQVGSIAGSTTYSGATSGAASGYNTHGLQYNQAEGIKGGSPCGGGCGGTSGSGYNGGYNFGHGGKVGSAATAKSLAGASAFGTGGSYASSSASAHASAGAYTKGGYGKR